jgi:hypothetical protein
MVKTSTFPWWENLILSSTKCYMDGGMYWGKLIFWENLNSFV